MATVDIGEQFLLGLSKQTKLANVKALDLSHRELERVDASLLQRVPNLQVLRVSDNALTSFPAGLRLPALRKLDVSENELKDVAFVESLTGLRELNIEGNYLDASDRFIAVILCPSLQILNGRNTASFKTFLKNKSAKLEEAIMELWEEKHGDQYEDGIPERLFHPLLAELREAALKLNVDNNTPYEKLRTSMINRICQEVMERVQSRHYTPLTPKRALKVSIRRLPPTSATNAKHSTKTRYTILKDSNNNRTPQKAKSGAGAVCEAPKTPKTPSSTATPSKSIMRNNTPGRNPKARKSISFRDVVDQATKSDDDDDEAEEEENKVSKSKSPRKQLSKSPGKSHALTDSPRVDRKRKREEEDDSPTLKSPSKARTPTKKTPQKSRAEPSAKRKRVEVELTELPSVPDYKPLHFMRCHFGDRAALRRGHRPSDDPTDGETRVWAAAFEPPRPRTPARSPGGVVRGAGGTVATCGGSSVCIVDCGSGRVMQRFQQEKEHFFCLAWTTIEMDKDKYTNILAVGGWNGHIRLLHPEQLVCYKEMGNNGRPNKSVVEFYVCCLKFHPHEPTLLFSGSSDATITLFDIGKPKLPNYDECDTTVLRIFDAPSDVLNLELCPDLSLMVAGCEDGCYVWDLTHIATKTTKRQKPCQELLIPKQEDWAVDGLTMLSDDLVASRSREDPSIYVWKLEPFNKAQDKLKVHPILQLEWTNSIENFIGLGCSMTGYLATGDEKGNLYLYDVSTLLENSVCAKAPLKPSRVLPWPELSIDTKKPKDSKMLDVINMKEAIVNCVAISNNHQYIVTGTDHNVLCIWKRSNEEEEET